MFLVAESIHRAVNKVITSTITPASVRRDETRHGTFNSRDGDDNQTSTTTGILERKGEFINVYNHKCVSMTNFTYIINTQPLLKMRNPSGWSRLRYPISLLLR